MRIRQDLRGKGIPAEVIDAELMKMPKNNSCADLARKHSSGKDLSDPKYKAKLVRFLQYRGYEWEDISQAIATLKLVDDDFD